jgi:hypothetical protein
VEIATACDVPTAAVGHAADREGIRVSECQLGLFGYEAYGEKRWVRRLAAIPKSLASETLAARVEDRLACAEAWRLADALGVPRLLMGSVAETLHVRISACQLGCFE